MTRRGLPSRPALLAGAAIALVAALPAAGATHDLPLLPGGNIVRVNVGPGGAQATAGLGGGQDADYPAVSANGRYVTFTTNTPGLVRLGSRCKAVAFALSGAQVYRRDLARGVTELVTVRPDGCPGGFGGVGPTSMSADGRFVAFITGSDYAYGHAGVVPGFRPAPGRTAVYVRDMTKHKTVAVSVGYDGSGNNDDATDPSISADGRYVAFDSSATNLVRHDPRKANGGSFPVVYIRDLRTGHIERIGPANARALPAKPTILPGQHPSVSANGRYVAFQSCYQFLDGTPNYGDPVDPVVPTYRDPICAANQVYVYDRSTRHFTMASRSDGGLSGDGDSDTGPPGQTLSADGRYVVFASRSNNLVPGDDDPVGTNWQTDPTPDIYLFDRVAHHLTRVSVGPAGVPANYGSTWPSISADGRAIVFHSGATNLGPVDATVPAADYLPTSQSVGYDVYLHDRRTGANTLVSTDANGVQGDFSSWTAAVSGDAGVVAFVSTADNLVPNDTNGGPDVFAWRPS